MAISLESPILLSANRFTPLKRTPWAGKNIGILFKKDIVPGADGKLIGESWEFSCDPEFPSYIAGTEISLSQLVADHPEQILSPKLAASSASSCEILVKLLNASSPLSLQVHPEDENDSLKGNECGKPESWLVVHSEPGAGLYIGFSEKMSRERLKDVLLDGSKAKDYLQFVEVAPGDYFEIEPGVPHAIGPGVTLLEPQRILFGKSGKTYRLWDWGRKYDDKGREDPDGKPRELHVDEALNLVDPQHQVGEEFVRSTMRKPSVNKVGQHTVRIFPENPYYQVQTCEISSGTSLKLSIDHGYGFFLTLKGELEIGGKSDSKSLPVGQPALLPYSAFPLTISGEGEGVLVTPSQAGACWA